MNDDGHSAADPVPAEFEKALASAFADHTEVADLLMRLARAVFPDGHGVGDPRRITWPENDRPGQQPAHRARLSADERLRAAEERFRTLVEQIPAVIFMAILGEGENEVYVSPHIEALLGFTQEEWLEDPFLWYMQLHPDDRQLWHEVFARGCRTGGPFRADCRFLARDGRVVWVHGEAIIGKDEQGRPTFLQGVAFDITLMKEAEEAIIKRRLAEMEAEVAHELAEARAQLLDELALSNRELEEANRELESFGYTVSHDLRAPVRAINAFSAILAEEHGHLLDADGQRVLGIIQKNAKKMGELIDNLLDFARLGRAPLHIQLVDMHALVGLIIEEIKTVEPDRAIEFRMTRLPPAACDPQLMRQVWINVIGNAVKYTRGRSPAVIEIDGESGERFTSYRVRDNGVGFNMDFAGKLFGVFQRLHTAAQFEGTGVGLAIVQRIVNRHGGQVSADGKVDEGATIRFTLPRTEDDAKT